jgi:hypothetical protein
MQMFSKFNRKSTSASWFGQQHPGISSVFSFHYYLAYCPSPGLRRSTSFPPAPLRPCFRDTPQS